MQSMAEIRFAGKRKGRDTCKHDRSNIILLLFCRLLDVYDQHENDLSSIFCCDYRAWKRAHLHAILWNESGRRDWNYRLVYIYIQRHASSQKITFFSRFRNTKNALIFIAYVFFIIIVKTYTIVWCLFLHFFIDEYLHWYIFNLNQYLFICFLHFAGYLSCTITVLFFAAPCCSLMDVFRKKSTEMLPFPLILMSFLVSVQWLVFGILAQDMFLQVPNALGAMLSGTQLLLFCIYPNKPRAMAGSEVPYSIF